jgi:hypothetical protein
LSKLECIEKTIRVAESVLGWVDVNIGKERDGPNAALFIKRIVSRVYITLTSNLALVAAEVDSFSLRVVFGDLDNGETVYKEEMGISCISHDLCGGRVIVELHLQTLAGKGIYGVGLNDLSRAVDDLLAVLIHSPYLENKVTVTHASMLSVNGKLVARKDHADKVSSYPQSWLDIRERHEKIKLHTNIRARGDLGRRRSWQTNGWPRSTTYRGWWYPAKEQNPGRIKIDRVEIVEYLVVRSMGNRCSGGSRSRRGDWIVAVQQRWGLALRGAMTLNVAGNSVTNDVFPPLLNKAGLDNTLKLIMDEDLARDGDGAVRVLDLVGELRADAEDELGTRLQRLDLVIPFELLLRLEHTNVGVRVDGDNIVWLLDELKCIGKVCKATAIEEDGSDLNNALTHVKDVTADLDGLASVVVGDRNDASLGSADVTNLERLSAFDYTEAIWKANKLEKVTTDRLGEDRLHDGLRIQV